MNTLTKCRLIYYASMLVAMPGILALIAVHASVWVFIATFFSFWMSGMMFLAAMLGDGKEGLGLKRKEVDGN